MHTLTWIDGWLTAIRPMMETFFFLATIALAIFAFKGLEQLKLAKEIANTNTKREAFKLAADQCRYFAQEVVPFSNKLFAECNKQKLTSFANPDPKFEVSKGEISFPGFSEAAVIADYQKCSEGMIAFLNSLEAFSLFFAAGIADESVAYRETGVTFCATVKRYIPAICMYRRWGVRYESTVKLFEVWNARLMSEKLMTDKKSIDAKLANLKKDPIETVGQV